MRRFPRVLSVCVSVAVVSVIGAFESTTLRGAGDDQALLVRCTVPCANVAAMVSAVGGTLTYQYENIDAIAARVPSSGITQLAAMVGGDAIVKDLPAAPPRPREQATIVQPDFGGAMPLATATLQSFIQSRPADYSFNNSVINAASVQAGGNLGAGIIVAVIDSGTANAPQVPALTGTVIGGESFVPASDPVTSPTSHLNGDHGTWVGTVIAGHVTFLFSRTSTLVRSLKVNAPNSVIDPCPGAPAAAVCVPMIGVAPAASIYALKVFASNSNSAPESRIIAAMDRAITLRRNFNQGGSTAPVAGTGSENDPFRYNALNIGVVNMSLGGPTLFAGRDLEDQLTQEMLKVGITPAISAGNDGFAAMTIGSPGSGLGALTLGAASTPAHERVLRDVQFGFGIGPLYRPSDAIQTAFFSSRGPTADGRFDPDVTANGFATFAQGAAGGISLVSGTSFSAPTAAGAAALVRKGVPSATATQVRNALALAANPAALGDGSRRIDQGSGMLDVAAAIDLLLTRHVSDVVPDLGRRGHHDDDDEVGGGGESVAQNIRNLGFDTIRFRNDSFATRLTNLKPGQAAQLFVPSDDRTTKLVVSFTNVTPEFAPAQQNQLFGDDIILEVADAPTSFKIARVDDEFVAANRSFTIDNPQTGIVRVTALGDWTNAGRISATVTITRERHPDGPRTFNGTVAADEIVPVKVDVPAGATSAVFELTWRQNWGRYPTDDLDMVLIDPLNHVIEDGATLNSPERVEIANPIPGTWTAMIIGATINDPSHDDDNDHDGKGKHDGDAKPPKEPFSFTALADGVRLTRIK